MEEIQPQTLQRRTAERPFCSSPVGTKKVDPVQKVLLSTPANQAGGGGGRQGENEPGIQSHH